MTRVLVCGSRDFNNALNLFTTMDALHVDYDFTIVIEGGATGADTFARRWAQGRGLLIQEHRAEWNKYGKAAGPIRNKQMLTEGKPDLVVAFPKGSLSESRGTKNMVEQAQKAGIPVILIDGDSQEHLPVQYTIDEEGSLA